MIWRQNDNFDKKGNFTTDDKLYIYDSYKNMLMWQFNESSKEENKSLNLSRKIYEILLKNSKN